MLVHKGLHCRNRRVHRAWPQRSRLLMGWRAAGFMTGALPALFGPRAVYATIAAVETFVDQHYQHQIDRLTNRTAPESPYANGTGDVVSADHARHAEQVDLRSLLIACQADEREHRDEATTLQAGRQPGWLLRAWCGVVGRGSAAAVGLARRL